MELHEDLLRLARRIAEADPSSQAALRRAVSTAYYALFHLLVWSAASNWQQVRLRSDLARLFQHGAMKAASETGIERLGDCDPLKRVALDYVRRTFVTALQKREDADYNTGRLWHLNEVLEVVAETERAFSEWETVKAEPAAQTYLLSLLGKRK